MHKSGMVVGISGLGKVAWVSVIIAGWKLPLYIALRYHSISFIVRAKFSDALGPRLKMYPSKSVPRPLKPVSDLGSELGFSW